MKFKRLGCWIGVMSGGLVLLLLLGGVLLLLPAVQTALVRQIGGSQFADFKVERVAAGFGSAEVTGLELTTRNGLKISLDQALSEASVFQLLGRGTLRIDSATAEGLVVDTSGLQPSDTPREPMSWPELVELALPRPLSLGETRLQGEWRGPHGMKATFTLTGKDVEPGQENHLGGSAAFLSPQANVETESVDLTFFQSESGGLSEINFASDVRADGRVLPNPKQLGVRLAIDSPKANVLQARTRALINGVESLNLVLAYDGTTQELFGQARIEAVTDLINPFLPQDLPALKAQSSLQFTLTREQLRIDPSSLRLTEASRAQPLAEITLERSLQLPFDGLTSALGGLDPGNWLRARLTEVPLPWAEPYLAGITFGESATLSSELVLAINDYGSLELGSPHDHPALEISQLNLAHNGTPLLRDVTVTSILRVAYGDDFNVKEAQVQLSDFRGAFATSKVSGIFKPAEMSARPVGLPGKGRSELTVELNRLLRQPIFANRLTAPRQGTLTSFVTWQPDGEATQIDGQARLRSLINAEGAPLADDLSVSLGGSVNLKTRTGTADSELHLVRAGQPDTQLRLGIIADLLAQTFNIDSGGPMLDVDAILAIVQVFVPEADADENEEAPEPPPTESPDETAPPVWDGWKGDADLALDAVRQGGRELRDVRGRITVNDGVINAEELSARFAGAPLNASGQLSWDPARSRFYALAAKAAFQDLPVGPLITPNGGSLARLTGTYSSAVELSAHGQTMPGLVQDLLNEGAVSMDLQGSRGVLRALSFASSETDRRGQLLDQLLAAASGRLGNSFQRIYQELKVLEYDALQLSLRREAGANRIDLPQISLQSSLLDFSAEGFVPTSDFLNFLTTNLKMQVNLTAKDQLAKAFADLGFGRSSDTSVDVPRFAIGGTLTNPNLSELTAMLIQRYQARLAREGLGSLFGLGTEPKDEDEAPTTEPAPDDPNAALERIGVDILRGIIRGQ